MKHDSPCELNCEHCNGPGTNSDRCCWATAMEIKKFKKRVKHKYIFEVIFDLIISTASVSTDIIALILYFNKGKLAFALLTGIPVLLPTFVFTNIYLADESDPKPAKKTLSQEISIISGNSKSRRNSIGSYTEHNVGSGESSEQVEDHASTFDTESTDTSIKPINDKRRYQQACLFHWSCFKVPITFWKNCCSGFSQCMCNRDHELRRKGAVAVKNSFQRVFKYGFGTFVLRFIAWMWYVKALIFGLKAYREPKKFMHIAAPDTHWSYELLVRLDFLQAALENAPQCVVQLYALITQSDEDVALGMLTLIISFVDFIRVAVSVHWDMHKGPVIAPNGCYRTLLWKLVNTSSWIFIYSARSLAIALVAATSLVTSSRLKLIFPVTVLILHIGLFGKLLHRVEYGVAAQKIVVTVFISIFFLPELDSSILPQMVQFYYATIIIQNTFFILPWEGFDQEYCLTGTGLVERPKQTLRPELPGSTPSSNMSTTARSSTQRTITFKNIFLEITPPPVPTEEPEHGCLIDPTWITLAVPTMTIFGVIFRLVASQKMHRYKTSLPKEDLERDNKTQKELEASITKLFRKNWTQMTAKEMLHAYLKMLRKEVIIIEKGEQGGDNSSGISDFNERKKADGNKRVSFLAARLQADFLASQTFIRESFSLMTRTTRSDDISIVHTTAGDDGEAPPEYNSDSELTFRRSNIKKRPRIPRSRNVSESLDASNEPDNANPMHVQVELPTGTQFLEMCWI